MDSAVNQAIDQANQTNNTILWVLFAVVVIAPIIVLFAASILAIVKQRELKCPKCGNWRKNNPKGIQTIRTVKGSKATLTTQSVIICRKCKHEFSV